MATEIDVNVLNSKAATVYVGRKASVKQYESIEVGIHMPAELPDRETDETDDAYAARASLGLQQVVNVLKVQVFDALGLKYTDENGVITEHVEKALAAPAPKERPAPAQRSTPSPSSAASGTAQDVPSCPECKGGMWDNRATKKGRQPDFKCKDRACNKAVWVG